jgi:predicted NBD/HSP70 family sugar kinase
MHLYIETRRSCALAIDISASRTLIMVTDLMGHPLLEVSEFPTRPHPESLVQELVRHIDRIFAAHPEVGQCSGIGVAIAGLVDLDGGLRYAPTMGWRDVDLLEPLAAATRLPVVVENSVKACVLAQVWTVRGDALVEGPVVFVNASDGVGVGIAIDGKLLRGANNIAGEFGHVPLSIYGPRCACGQRGCWEAYVSNRATVARYLGEDASWPESAALTEVTVADVVARARSGEGRALETLRETGDFLGRGFANIIKAVNPRRIYMSGEITEAWDLIEATVRDTMRGLALIPAAGEIQILIVPLGELPRLRGAAALVSAPAFAAPVVA